MLQNKNWVHKKPFVFIIGIVCLFILLSFLFYSAFLSPISFNGFLFPRYVKLMYPTKPIFVQITKNHQTALSESLSAEHPNKTIQVDNYGYNNSTLLARPFFVNEQSPEVLKKELTNFLQAHAMLYGIDTFSATHLAIDTKQLVSSQYGYDYIPQPFAEKQNNAMYLVSENNALKGNETLSMFSAGISIIYTPTNITIAGHFWPNLDLTSSPQLNTTVIQHIFLHKKQSYQSQSGKITFTIQNSNLSMPKLMNIEVQTVDNHLETRLAYMETISDLKDSPVGYIHSSEAVSYSESYLVDAMSGKILWYYTSESGFKK